MGWNAATISKHLATECRRKLGARRPGFYSRVKFRDAVVIVSHPYRSAFTHAGLPGYGVRVGQQDWTFTIHGESYDKTKRRTVHDWKLLVVVTPQHDVILVEDKEYGPVPDFVRACVERAA